MTTEQAVRRAEQAERGAAGGRSARRGHRGGAGMRRWWRAAQPPWRSRRAASRGAMRLPAAATVGRGEGEGGREMMVGFRVNPKAMIDCTNFKQ